MAKNVGVSTIKITFCANSVDSSFLNLFESIFNIRNFDLIEN
jgi:hypothetical protein